MRNSAYPKEDALVVQQLDQVVRRRGHEAARVELLGCFGTTNDTTRGTAVNKTINPSMK
jgi:hypothetical protein